jgi:thiol-disulfide isomerase/thioredoxin
MKLLVAFAGAMLFGVVGCSAGAPDRPEMALAGKPAPDFKLPLLAGGEVELSALKGKNVVLLDFWATWCGPCRTVMPALDRVSKDYESKGVRYLAVNLREEPAKINAYLKQAGLNLEVPLDKDGKVAGLYNVRGIPTMVIVDKEGIVRDVHVGASPNLESDLRKTLDKIVGG